VPLADGTPALGSDGTALAPPRPGGQQQQRLVSGGVGALLGSEGSFLPGLITLWAGGFLLAASVLLCRALGARDSDGMLWRIRLLFGGARAHKDTEGLAKSL
jgi:hypothetical protein